MPNILVLDIETAPETVYAWSRFKANIGQTQVKVPGYLLCISWAWLNKADDLEFIKTESISIYKSSAWRGGNQCNDINVVKKAHELLNKADIVIGHNIKEFDIGTLNARFVHHNLLPPSPFKICDTLKILKKCFHMPSYSLESASHYFGIVVKDKQPFTLWAGCLEGKRESWDNMVEYCKHDVYVTSLLYTKLRPWAINHPNMGLYYDNIDMTCTKCGSKNLHRRGVQKTQVNTYQRYRCNNCGGWSRSRHPSKNINKKNILANII